MISRLIVKMMVGVTFLALCGCGKALSSGPYQATGIKIGETTDNSAIIWTRLTRGPQRVGAEAPMPKISYRDSRTGALLDTRKGSRQNRAPVVTFPADSTMETIEGAVPGAPGKVRVLYRMEGVSDWSETDWRAVDPKRDYTCQFKLTNLRPETRYQLRVEARRSAGSSLGQLVEGAFRTAPRADESERVVFTVSTGQAYPDQDAGGGFRIYSAMLKLDPSFFVHTGDILYYDALAKTAALARWHWARMYSLPTNVEFHRRVASYFIKDDHDTWLNDCWPSMKTPFMGDFTFKQGQLIFLEQVPMGERTWRTFRWGRDLQIWLVEGRDFRSPNTMPDGPGKTIWGNEQKAWFKRTVQESDAAFRILISPTPIVGPDRTNKHDNHSNVDFQHEGKEIRSFIATQKNMYVICGDRHWQYISADQESGVREYSCGPASDEHAGGWSNDMRRPEHKYLNVIGGFLAGTVERLEGKPTLTFRHYSVDGDILNEDRLTAQ
ncbi:MAG: alkaline phosphatase D family protein [Planctomycetota bacterium]|jgi:alkaline phosphatase D